MKILFWSCFQKGAPLHCSIMLCFPTLKCQNKSKMTVASCFQHNSRVIRKVKQKDVHIKFLTLKCLKKCKNRVRKSTLFFLVYSWVHHAALEFFQGSHFYIPNEMPWVPESKPPYIWLLNHHGLIRLCTFLSKCNLVLGVIILIKKTWAPKKFKKSAAL